MQAPSVKILSDSDVDYRCKDQLLESNLVLNLGLVLSR